MKLRKKIFKAIFFTSVLFFNQTIFSVVVGSNTIMSRESHVDFPAADHDNEIRGFAALEQGFALEDVTTSCTYNAYFPVSGDVVLNGGSLGLNRDLVLCSILTMTSLGNIYGNGYALELASTFQNLGAENASPYILKDITLGVNSNITLSAPLYFEGNCTIDGKSNVLTLSSTGNLIVGPNSTLLIKDATINGLQNQNIRCENDTSVLILQNVNLMQSDDFVFVQGALYINNKVTVQCAKIFTYQSTQACTIHANAKLELEYGTTFSYDPVALASKELLAFEDETSILALDGATLHTTTTGMTLKHGKLLVKNDSILSSEILNDLDEGITLGNNSADDDFICVMLSGVTLNLAQGSLNYKNVVSDSWQMQNVTSKFYMYSGTRLNLYQTLQLGKGLLCLGNDAMLGIAAGADLIGSIVPEVSFVIVSVE